MTTKARTVSDIEMDGIELLRREAAGVSQLTPYTRRECERLLALMRKFSKELEKPLPDDPESREIIIQMHKGEMAVFEQIIKNVIELNKRGEGPGSQPNRSRVGTNKDADPPQNTMPFVQPARLPANNMRLPGPRRPR